MGNNVYSYSNVEAMIKSVRSNKEIINNMLDYTRDNDKAINERLSDYAKYKKNMGDGQIEMYRTYINSKESVEGTLKEYRKKIEDNGYMHQMAIELHSIDSDYSILHKAFEEINKMQVKIMEMLCRVISSANILLGSL